MTAVKALPSFSVGNSFFVEEFPAGKKVQRARMAQRPKISQYDVAEIYLGSREKRTTVQGWESGANTPKTDVVKRMAADWGIPLTWFFDGKDTPLPERLSPSIIQDLTSGTGAAPVGGHAPGYAIGRGSQAGVGRRNFPILGSAGAAAHPIEPGDAEDFMEFSDDLVDRHRFQFVIKALGDSGESEFSHGDWFLVTKDEGFRLPGFFCVIRTPDHQFLVKLSKSTDDGLEFHACNPEYKPVTLGDGWEMVGYAVGWKREKGTGKYIEAGDRDGLRPGFRG